MKKLKTILCLMLMLVFCMPLLYACAGEDDPADEDAGATLSTITLLEAKPIILNALMLDDNSQTSDNRDIFAKLGKIKVTSSLTMAFGTESSTASGDMYIDTNAPYAFKADAVASATYNGVTAAGPEKNFYYSPTDKTIYVSMKTPLGTDIEKDELGEVNSFYDIMKSDFIAGQSFGDINSDYIFSDAFFDKCCKNEVTKITKENGYSLVLEVSYNAQLKLQQGCETDEEYEQYIRNKYESWNNQQYLDEELNAFNENKNLFDKLRIDFNLNNQIIALRVKEEGCCIYEEGVKGSMSMSSIITSYTGEISEPQWVTDYIASQNNQN